MGFLSWLFPSPADRLKTAQALLAKGRFADALAEAESLELPDAAEVVQRAKHALCLANLDEAISWAHAGDLERVDLHFEVAASFGGPELGEATRRAREQVAAIFGEKQAHAAAAAEIDKRALMDIDDRFLDAHADKAPDLPEGTSPEEADELQMRLALWMEAYPEALQRSMLELGPDFASAKILLEDGKFEEALSELIALPDDEPLVLHERARAALALGDPGAAARAWRGFARAAGGHLPMGGSHTAIMLADALARSGQVDEALTTLKAEREQGMTEGDGLYAMLLEATGDLEGAEALLRGLIKKHPKQQDFYVALARIRSKGGFRMEAMQALERSLTVTECTPGRCGYQPPHLGTHRMLATLYLEDGVESDRGLELADVAKDLVRQPVWEDLYLAALAAHRRTASDASALLERLVTVTPDGDPRHDRIRRYMAA
ncbi:MAG: tetratricopeptide repeat protein [Myxococcota bacterium]